MKKTEDKPRRCDPMIEEVRQARVDLGARFGNDVGRLCDYLRQIEAQHAKRVIRVHPPETSRR